MGGEEDKVWGRGQGAGEEEELLRLPVWPSAQRAARREWKGGVTNGGNR